MKSIVDLDNVTLCSHCGELVTEFTKEHGHDLIESQDDCSELTHDGVESLYCDACNHEMQEDDTYYMLTVSGDILNDIADRLGEQIGGCEYCEGEERGHIILELSRKVQFENTLIQKSRFYAA